MSNTVIVCIALLGILIFVLGANVTRHRIIRGATGNQAPSDPADRMFLAQRAHGNASEYVPTMIGLLIVGSTLTDGWWINTLAVVAVAARYLHAIAVLTSKTMAGRVPARDVGAILTYLSGSALAVTVLASL